MLCFRTEWQEAPGVKDRVLARTWARLEIRMNGHAPEGSWPSNLIGPADNVQRGTYGSVFPLAEWIVENWWFLLHEARRLPELWSGRMLARDPLQRPWVQRHNVLAAREGGALPDLTFYRDGPAVVASWFPDPVDEDSMRPVRFFTRGEVRLEPRHAEQAFHDLVEEVVIRLDQADDEDTRRLRKNWQELCHSRQTEAELCSWAAQLGIDPYDSSEFTEELTEVLEGHVRPLTDDLRTDLLQASTPGALANNVRWVTTALQKGDVEPASTSCGTGSSGTSAPGAASAHELGYQRAAWFRKEFSLPLQPLTDLAAVLHERCGWPRDPAIDVETPPSLDVAALVGKSRGGLPRVMSPRFSPESQRFLLARAVYFFPTARTVGAPRLVTRTHVWDQRASRAFAAELLAPAEALRQDVQGGVASDKVTELARKFQVSSRVIEHQLLNHRIGWSEEL